MLDGKQFRDATVPPRKFVAPLAVAYASAISLDTAAAADFAIGALTGNTYITLTNATAGRQGSIAVRQDGTGGRTVWIVAAGFVRYRDTALASLDAASGANAITLYTYALITVAGASVLLLDRVLPVASDPLTYDGDHSDLTYDGDHTQLTYG